MADFDSLEKKIEEGFRLSNVRFEGLEKQITTLLETTTAGFKRVDERFVELENQIDTLAISTAKGFDFIYTEFNEVKERIGNLETHADIVDQKLERIDRNIGTLMDASVSNETRVTKLEATA